MSSTVPLPRFSIKELKEVHIVGTTREGKPAKIVFPATDISVELNKEVTENTTYGHVTSKSESGIKCTFSFTYQSVTYIYE